MVSLGHDFPFRTSNKNSICTKGEIIYTFGSVRGFDVYHQSVFMIQLSLTATIPIQFHPHGLSSSQPFHITTNPRPVNRESPHGKQFPHWNVLPRDSFVLYVGILRMNTPQDGSFLSLEISLTGNAHNTEKHIVRDHSTAWAGPYLFGFLFT